MMDRLAAMRLFVRVVERRSFSAAAADLGLSRSSATAGIKALERELGTALLRRTTRHVAPTSEGAAYHRRCEAVLAAIDDAEAEARGSGAEGLLRVDTNAHLARTWLLPALPGFLARHPRLRLHLGEGDRLVDLVGEGIDCVIRGGALSPADLTVRRLGHLAEITAASPSYLERAGVPRTPDDLAGHEMVGFLSSRVGRVLPLEFRVGGSVREVALPARVTASSSDSSATLARLGYGLIQAPLVRFAADLRTGAMVEVLQPFRPAPMPISLLYPRMQLVPSRLRAFIDWLDEALVPHLDRG